MVKKAFNDDMNMGEITVKTDRIGMEIDFEAEVIHISNCLSEVWYTRRILSVETEL